MQHQQAREKSGDPEQGQFVFNRKTIRPLNPLHNQITPDDMNVERSIDVLRKRHHKDDHRRIRHYSSIDGWGVRAFSLAMINLCHTKQ